ncbi:MAG: hypothetical protein MOGMAGMI_01345 [Candidatus Omnitrophica bacterium]|nr:hypothetical protein [Candidatus Omnitrophota bacterium]
MYLFLIFVHVVVCLVLIFVVLLQAGRGGGFSEMFGGGQPSSILGTQTNTFMTRATEVCAVIFVITSLSLGLMSAQKSKSLVQQAQKQDAVKAALAQAKATTETAGSEAKTAAGQVAASAGAVVQEAEQQMEKALDQAATQASQAVEAAGQAVQDAEKAATQG